MDFAKSGNLAGAVSPEYQKAFTLLRVLPVMAHLGFSLAEFKRELLPFAEKLHESDRTPDGYAASFGQYFSSNTSECTEKASKYQEKLDKGMKAEAKDEREKAKLEQEAAIEKRGEEHKRTEESTEPNRPQEADQVQISQAAKAALKNSQPLEVAEPVSSEPVIYTPAGEVSSVPAETEPSVSFSA